MVSQLLNLLKILQAIYLLDLYKHHDVQLQIGGAGQWTILWN